MRYATIAFTKLSSLITLYVAQNLKLVDALKYVDLKQFPYWQGLT